MSKEYLGDSVYAEIEDGMILLTTENGYGATNHIYMEWSVYSALKTFARTYMFDTTEEKTT